MSMPLPTVCDPERTVYRRFGLEREIGGHFSAKDEHLGAV